jgi:cyclopropane-fatty-acyl-phospholipid synthase
LSTQADIAVTYDVSNSFFSLWLDRWMIYSCALFEGTDDLDQAQVNKLTWFFEKARVTPEKRVLDIGCGWGGLMDFFALEKGAKDLTGITLSQAQYNWVKEKGTPGVKVEFGSYLNYQPKRNLMLWSVSGCLNTSPHLNRSGAVRI